MTQIMNLLLLAPKIQESLLDLVDTNRGRAPSEKQIRSVGAKVLWEAQYSAFDRALGLASSSHPTGYLQRLRGKLPLLSDFVHQWDFVPDTGSSGRIMLGSWCTG